MSRPDPDRPLTDAQERALIRLAEIAADRWASGPSGYGKPCRNVTTLLVLHERGLAEIRLRRGSLDYEGRITDAGRAMLRSMGD